MAKTKLQFSGIMSRYANCGFKVHGKCLDSVVAIRINYLVGMLQTSVAC